MSTLLARLPPVRGRYTPDAPLKDVTWFRVGGPADVVFRPADADDLSAFLRAVAGDVPVQVIGVGSNLLVRDGGVRGVVIRLGAGFSDISIEPGHRLRAEAGALDVAVARAAAEAEIAGLEFLRGVPGTIGGGLAMNAGAYGSEFKDVLVSVDAMRRDGTRVTLTPSDMGFAYRTCAAAQDHVFLAAVFQGRPGVRTEIEARMAEITAQREASQPVRARTGGSTFRNPPGAKAWTLIDAAGYRGRRRGGAQVSEQHCNFLINTGDATAADLEALGEEVQAAVEARSGVRLEWEIKRIGDRPGGGA